MTLDPRDDVKYGLTGLLGDLEILKLTAPCATAPYTNRYRICQGICASKHDITLLKLTKLKIN